MLRTILLALAMFCVTQTGTAQVPPPRPPELNVQYHRAETAYRSGASMLEAKARVDRVLESLPQDAEALKLRARVLLNLNRSEEAVVDAEKAVQLNPKDAEAYLILCEAARQSEDVARAEEALGQAASLVFNDAALHVRLSWNAEQLGLLEKAEAFARTALALDGTISAGYYQLARVFMLKQQPEAAALILRQGFERELLDASVVRADTELAALARHPALQTFLAN